MQPASRMQTVEVPIYGSVLVRACAMTCPGGPSKPSKGVFLICGCDMWLWNEVAIVLGLELENQVADVFRHHFDGCHEAAMTKRGVRTHQGEVIRHIGGGDRQIGVWVLQPTFPQVDAIASHDWKPRRTG